MNYNRVISIAVLFLLLGTTLPAFAETGQEQKAGGEEKAPPAQHQAAQKAQPQRAQKTAPQTAQKATLQRAQKAPPQTAQRAMPQRAQKSQPPASANNRGGQYGRISNASYTAHFGSGHSFHMMTPQMSGGYNRFQYGGYSFGFNQGWPAGWSYSDTVYVVYVGGAYYLYDLSHPGIHITLSIF